MQRYDYIDIARGLGILAVIWGHIIWQHWTGGFVYTFHMPLFFFISGMLFKRPKYPSFMVFAQKRARRLFVPYLWYSVVTWMIWAGFNYAIHRPVESYWNPLLQTILAQGSGAFMVHNSPLWFIPCLFAVEIMYYFTSRFNDVINIILCLMLAALSVFFESRYGDGYLLLLPWNFDAALMALPFYAVGNLIMKHTTHQQINDLVRQHQMMGWCLALVLFGGLVYSVFAYGSLSMGYSSYGNEYIFHVRALAGCVATILLAILLSICVKRLPTFLRKVYDFIIWFGVVSLDVMCTHVPIKGFIIVGIATVMNQGKTEVMSNVGLALLVFLMTLIIDAYIVQIIQRIKLKYKLLTTRSK